MKNIDKAKLLQKTLNFFKKNRLNITSCGCCGGFHLELNDGDELDSGCDFLYEAKDTIKFYKENANKIYIRYVTDRFTEIEMIKDGNKIVNLGGRSHPYMKYAQRITNIDGLFSVKRSRK